jgi:hypothetical protein
MNSFNRNTTRLYGHGRNLDRAFCKSFTAALDCNQHTRPDGTALFGAPLLYPATTI